MKVFVGCLVGGCMFDVCMYCGIVLYDLIEFVIIVCVGMLFVDLDVMFDVVG